MDNYKSYRQRVNEFTSKLMDTYRMNEIKDTTGNIQNVFFKYVIDKYNINDELLIITVEYDPSV